MIWGAFGIVIVIFLALLIFKVLGHAKPSRADYPYTKKKVLFSPAERSFLGVLSQAINDDAQLFGKVRVADVITPRKGTSRSDWQVAFNKISGKHFDYIICDKDDLSIICAVELDDLSHNSKVRKERDVFLVGACEAASVPLIQVKAKASYNIEEIRALLNPYLSNEPVSESKNDVLPELHAEKMSAAPITNEEDTCPKCSEKLVKRVAKKGKHAGEEFLACGAFPKCRYIKKATV